MARVTPVTHSAPNSEFSGCFCAVVKGEVWRCLPRSYMPTANNNYSICISSDVNIRVLPFESFINTVINAGGKRVEW